MHAVRLSLNRFRCFETVELCLSPGLNLLTGDNGAGKTSVLEALHLMAYGRSFRGRVRDGLIRQGSTDLEVFVEWCESAPGTETGRFRRAGLRHSGQSWRGRLDGSDVVQLGTLCAALAVVSFEPGSHSLISGVSETRRRFLDWGLFHVEHDFLVVWRRYARALKQRNALLKQGASAAQLDAWDFELSESGEQITSRRLRYLERLQDRACVIADAIAPGLALTSLDFSPGWRRQDLSLADALLLSRERDVTQGHTFVGPHRADWRPGFATLPGRETLSRGQAKLTALACLLSQAEDFATERGEWPILALDDLASELDRNHQDRVMQRLLGVPAQVLVTSTERPSGYAGSVPAATFHVEHGRITSVSGARC